MTTIQNEVIQSINSTNALNNRTERSEKVDALEKSPLMNGDRVDISDEGKRIGKAMQQMGKIPPPEMMESIDSIQNSISSLNLDSLDIEDMSDEELTETISNINGFLESINSENTVSIDALSTDEKVEFVTNFKNDSDDVMNTLDQMKGMVAGRPPVGGRPPKGEKGPKKAEGIEVYDNLTSEDIDDDELSMIEQILEALEESDDNEENEVNMNEFYSIISEYLTTEN
ncbi:hypothetical protein QUF55_03650 [Clostridiaceae bacterium HSG29]|nr:hypothetical protein [Clostridiaceae bacterium HSG29]